MELSTEAAELVVSIVVPLPVPLVVSVLVPVDFLMAPVVVPVLVLLLDPFVVPMLFPFVVLVLISVDLLLVLEVECEEVVFFVGALAIVDDPVLKAEGPTGTVAKIVEKVDPPELVKNTRAVSWMIDLPAGLVTMASTVSVVLTNFPWAFE
jgi:hypothetical protein